MPPPFSWRDAATEALSNMFTSPGRSLFTGVMIFLVFTASLGLSGMEAERINTTSTTQIAEGRFAFIAFPTDSATLTSTDCEAANQIVGVEAAGAFVDERSATVLAGSRTIRVLDVTEGYARAAWPDVSTKQLGVIAGNGIAKSLGLTDGAVIRLDDGAPAESRFVDVNRAESHTSRISGIDDALVQIVARPATVRQCVIWSTPSAYAAVGQALEGWFGPQVSVADFLPQIGLLENPQRQFDTRLSQFAWLLAAVVVLVLLLIGWIADREQIALYRILGLRERHVIVIAATQLVVLSILPLQAAGLLVIGLLQPRDQLTLTVLAHNWASILLALLTFPPIAWALLRRRSSVDHLKGK